MSSYSQSKEIRLSDINIDSLENEERPNLWHRMFGPLNEGSLRAAVFNMASLSFGPSTLAIPMQMNNMSFLVGVIFIFIGSYLSYFSLTRIFLSASKEKEMDYSKLTKKVLGWPFSLLLNVAIIFFIVGNVISNQVCSFYIISL